MVVMVKRNLFVSYHFGIDRDDEGQPDQVGFGNRVLYLHMNQLKDEDDLRKLESQIEALLCQEMGTEDATVILLDYKWMGD